MAWPPEGSVTCGSVFACRAYIKQGDVCVETHAPKNMSCTVSPTLPAGTCSSDGACSIAQPPRADWTYHPGIHHWKIAGLAEDSSLLLSEVSSPYDFLSDFISFCRITRFDPAQPHREQVLYEGHGPAYPWVLHRRYVVGSYWPQDGGKQRWVFVALDGSAPTREFDLNAMLEERLEAEGVTAATEKPLWVQGAPGQLLLVWPLEGGKVWIGSVALPALEFAWTHQVTGTLRGTPIADELGRLYLAVDLGRVVSVSPEGTERWSVNGGGLPVAVFRDTLFLADGTVRSTDDGGKKYTWPVNQTSVFLSESHAAVLAPCDTDRCTQVTLLRRATGEVLTQVQVPDASAKARPTDTSGLLTADGAVLITQQVSYPDLMSSPFYSYVGLRRFLVREGSPLQTLGEILEPEGEGVERSLLHNGQWLGLERGPYHNDPDPPADLIGVAVPGLRPPEHGWLTPQGNLAGGSAPE